MNAIGQNCHLQRLGSGRVVVTSANTGFWMVDGLYEGASPFQVVRSVNQPDRVIVPLPSEITDIVTPFVPPPEMIHRVLVLIKGTSLNTAFFPVASPPVAGASGNAAAAGIPNFAQEINGFATDPFAGGALGTSFGDPGTEPLPPPWTGTVEVTDIFACGFRHEAGGGTMELSTTPFTITAELWEWDETAAPVKISDLSWGPFNPTLTMYNPGTTTTPMDQAQVEGGGTDDAWDSVAPATTWTAASNVTTWKQRALQNIAVVY